MDSGDGTLGGGSKSLAVRQCWSGSSLGRRQREAVVESRQRVSLLVEEGFPMARQVGALLISEGNERL
ncbi:hypothetical protein CORC01_05813 [Colletotrichum orchidophilum]|uniref:Uncharacterized protein n=1 Tax=Colletotrichum orchidophilum TaxID=1209926 RepID=A0A1G4BC18_9PEZI|nr:uncharacterized protein CORC01_05813 [Colletotrichum orchidophilum]OHE98917.1 hypothetical protein CORC01_05813 [Colletotrichum orchidophilum]